MRKQRTRYLKFTQSNNTESTFVSQDFVDLLYKYLKKDGRLYVSGVGTFSLKKIKPAMQWSIRERKMINRPAYTRVKFTPCAQIKRDFNI